MGAKPPYKPYKPQGTGGGPSPDPHKSKKRTASLQSA